METHDGGENVSGAGVGSERGDYQVTRSFCASSLSRAIDGATGLLQSGLPQTKRLGGTLAAVPEDRLQTRRAYQGGEAPMEIGLREGCARVVEYLGSRRGDPEVCGEAVR